MHSFKTAVDAPRSLRPSEIQYSIRSVDHDSVRSVMVVGVELVVCLVHQPTSEESRLLTYIYIYIYGTCRSHCRSGIITSNSDVITSNSDVGGPLRWICREL